MSDELRAATDLMRGDDCAVETFTVNGGPGKQVSIKRYAAALTLGAAYLAEHPAADAEPTTAERLVGAGFTLAPHPAGGVIADYPLDEQTGWHLWLRIRLPIMEAQLCHGMPVGESEGIALTKADVRTWGAVRRLLTALGGEA
jgi:hypothetical protein